MSKATGNARMKARGSGRDRISTTPAAPPPMPDALKKFKVVGFPTPNDNTPSGDTEDIPSNIFDSVDEGGGPMLSGRVAKSEGVEVSMKDIVATQGWIDQSHVQKMVSGKVKPKPPKLIYQESTGKYYVVDGHHSIVSQSLKGSKSVKADVFRQAPPQRDKKGNVILGPKGRPRGWLGMAAMAPDKEKAYYESKGIPYPY